LDPGNLVHHRNRHAILHQDALFHPNRTTCCENMTVMSIAAYSAYYSFIDAERMRRTEIVGRSKANVLLLCHATNRSTRHRNFCPAPYCRVLSLAEFNEHDPFLIYSKSFMQPFSRNVATTTNIL